jgi:hypothetical protein
MNERIELPGDDELARAINLHSLSERAWAQHKSAKPANARQPRRHTMGDTGRSPVRAVLADFRSRLTDGAAHVRRLVGQVTRATEQRRSGTNHLDEVEQCLYGFREAESIEGKFRFYDAIPIMDAAE